MLSMSLSLERVSERDELAVVADELTRAISTVDGMPYEVKLVQGLPYLQKEFEVTIFGTIKNGAQIIRVLVVGWENVERVIATANEINEGNFTLSSYNPKIVRLHKVDEVKLELI
jgi:hypothetical protein